MATIQVARARAILGALGARVTPGGIAILAAWQACEGMPLATNNPMATTQPAPGAGTWNSEGVKTYPTTAVGIQATVHTLLNGRYPKIVAALREGSVPAFLAAPGEIGTWGTGYACLASRLGGRAITTPTRGATGGITSHPSEVAAVLIAIPVGLIVLDAMRRV